jgi:septum site-determining protein MinD
MAKIYGLISGKGGTGKTTSAINLGAALNSLGEDVVIVDANLSTPNIGLHLGASVVPVNLNQVLDNRAKLEQAIYKHESGLKILPSSLSIKELRKIKYEKLKEVGKKLKKSSEHIIFDSSAGLGRETRAVIDAADELILVTQAEMPAITDALKIAKLAEQFDKEIKGFILTRHKNKKTEMSLDNIKDLLEIPLLGIVPEDKNMQQALSLKNAIIHTHPKSKSAKAYKDIARKLIGKEEEKPSFFKFWK